MFLSYTSTKGSKKNKGVTNEDIDFTWLLYMYTTVLGLAEEDFWNSNLDKVCCLAEKHVEMNSNDKKNNKGYNAPKKQGVSYSQETEKLMAVDD